MVLNHRTMDFFELQCFLGVVLHGGITSASMKLGVSKSTVSTNISSLEKRLNLKLLERSSRRVLLTKEGERIFPQIKSIFAEIDALLENAGSAIIEPRGEVRIALPPALGGIVIKDLAPRISRLYPEISLLIVPRYTLEDLRNPSFDFAIRVGQVKDDSLVAMKVGVFSRILVCSKNSPLRYSTSLDDLKNARLIGFSSDTTGISWALQNKHDRSNVVALESHAQVSLQDFDIVLRLIRDGHGIGMVPDFMLDHEVTDDDIVRMLPEWSSPPVDVMLAYRSRATHINRISVVLAETKHILTSILKPV